MNIADAAKSLLSLLGEAENAVTHGPELIALVTTAVHEAESTAQSGQDKLTSVLNQGEVFLQSAIPQAAEDLEAIMKAVEDFVEALVELYDETGAFIKGVENTLDVG